LTKKLKKTLVILGYVVQGRIRKLKDNNIGTPAKFCEWKG